MEIVLDHVSHYILKVCIVPYSVVLKFLLSCQKRLTSDISEKILKIIKYILPSTFQKDVKNLGLLQHSYNLSHLSNCVEIVDDA